MKKGAILMVALLFGGVVLAQAQTTSEPIKGINNYDTVFIGKAVETASTVEASRTLALNRALDQALVYIDTAFTSSALTSDNAEMLEKCEAVINIYIQKTEQGFQTTAECMAKRKRYTATSKF
ncbi:MAG: hypothetical protein ACSW8I_02110 [bacterium]